MNRAQSWTDHFVRDGCTEYRVMQWYNRFRHDRGWLDAIVKATLSIYIGKFGEHDLRCVAIYKIVNLGSVVT